MTRALLTALLLLATPALAQQPVPAKKHPGCFVLLDLKTGQLKRNDAKRCENRNELPVSERTRETVKRMLLYTPETVTERTKRMAGPWSEGAVVSGKTGSTHTKEDGDVSWLVGHVRSAKGEYVFASLVTGEHLEGPVALHAAVDELHSLGVLD